MRKMMIAGSIVLGLGAPCSPVLAADPAPVSPAAQTAPAAPQNTQHPKVELPAQLLSSSPSAEPAAENKAPPLPATMATAPVPEKPAAPEEYKSYESRHPVTSALYRFYLRMRGKTNDDPDPSQTLIAPFADSSAPKVVPGELLMQRLPTNSIPMDQPHRSAAEMSELLSQAFADAMSFSVSKYDAHLKLLSNGYSPAALSQFDAWMRGSGILDYLKKNNMQMNVSVEEPPFLLNEGAVEGRYRWLFETPVIISFVPEGTKSLKGQTGIDSRRLLITVQLGRSKNSMLIDQIAFESWSVQENKRKH